MRRRPAMLLLGAIAGLLPACLSLPTNSQLPPASGSDFASAPPDALGASAPPEVNAPTKFAPQFTLSFQSLKAGEEPAVTTSVYQTKGELEVHDSRTLVENGGFIFQGLKVGQQVGYGQMDIGTPPKLSLTVDVRVTATDGSSTATLSVKASSPLASVYVADQQIQQLPGALEIDTLGNASRADAVNGIYTTQVSAKVTETLLPGFFTLPSTAGVMRTQTVFTSEALPADGITARKVFTPAFTVD